MKLKLKNPSGWIHGATIAQHGEYFFLNVQTKYGDKSETSRSLQSVKVLFGKHCMTGAKWETVAEPANAKLCGLRGDEKGTQ